MEFLSICIYIGVGVALGETWSRSQKNTAELPLSHLFLAQLPSVGFISERLLTTPSTQGSPRASEAPLKSSRREETSQSLFLLEAPRLILLGLAWSHAPSKPITVAGEWDELIGVARSQDLLRAGDGVSIPRTCGFSIEIQDCEEEGRGIGCSEGR